MRHIKRIQGGREEARQSTKKEEITKNINCCIVKVCCRKDIQKMYRIPVEIQGKGEQQAITGLNVFDRRGSGTVEPPKNKNSTPNSMKYGAEGTQVVLSVV
mmetsp:Transcript_2437/g.9188  ORF Transcript_2437/g.9188 Transcript_2437/m.9188 type:complete len:101 (-) Transcript_2437:49-351(-)